MSLRKSTKSRLIPNRYITHDKIFFQQRIGARKPVALIEDKILDTLEKESNSYIKLRGIYTSLISAVPDEKTTNLYNGIPLRIINTWRS